MSDSNDCTARNMPPNTSVKRHRFIQNYLLMWYDPTFDESNDKFHNSITRLRCIVNTIDTFNDADQCIDSLTDINDEKVFLIVTDIVEQDMISLVHDIPQLHSIYIYCDKQSNEELWMKKYLKIKGIFTHVDPICELLEQETRHCDHNLVPMCFFPPNDNTLRKNLDELDQSFMYTKLLTEILSEFTYTEHSIKDLAGYCRDLYIDNDGILNIINKFEQEYYSKSPIWWYTCESFLYTMLNYSLRTQNIDMIYYMGLFIRDLHQHIKQLHLIQSNNQEMQSFVVYRGQGMSNIEFEKLKKSQGGLLSFNNFLSTSIDRQVSHAFAESNGTNNTDLTIVGVLFEITIDSSITSTPFALLDNVSFYRDLEKEILFSTHTIFRINEINQLGDNNRLWQVKLTTTNDDDEQLKILTEKLREETEGSTEVHRLGQLLIKLGEFDKVEQLYKVLLSLTSDDDDKAFICGQLGWIKDLQGNYEEAKAFYEQTIEIYEKNSNTNQSDIATYYNNIGSVYGNMGEYLNAFTFYEKALEIYQKTLTPNRLEFAISYKNLASMCKNMSEYSEALLFYEKALEIEENNLPSNHSDIATTYNKIGSLHNTTGHYQTALLFSEKALEIRQKTLPQNHPDLASSYITIADIYENLAEHSKALSLYEKTLEIYEKILIPDHPDLANLYNHIGMTYDSLNEYSNALSYYEKSLKIWQEIFPSNHPNLASIFNNIGLLYYHIDEHSKALLMYEKALEIYQNIFPDNHSLSAGIYNNMGLIYSKIGEYSKALSSYEKAREIYQSTFSIDHPDYTTCLSNIGSIYFKTGEYSKALTIFESALEIAQHILPDNHPTLEVFKNNIEIVRESF